MNKEKMLICKEKLEKDLFEAGWGILEIIAITKTLQENNNYTDLKTEKEIKEG
jgi:hypothetical protein